MDNVNKWLTLTANVGVLIGIIFLVVEVEQNTTMIESQVALSRADTAMNQAAALHDSEYLPKIIVSITKGNPLDDEDIVRYTAYLRSFNRNQDYNYSQYVNGLLGKETIRAMRQAVQVEIAGRAPARNIWNLSKQGYSDGYINFVESIINEND